ncbi:hypothetical protein [Magnetospirillum molischianum]|uniref:Uncharacterized protein n=1 Tax=Magnetospirillum molischianum DSM 120 TaxID=1150626 RepID=H8FVN7_MAGML|nr:hypothetical protein [Magnetospirillum molischianum]CCG42425.1 hypothetical protein PHAMO_380093 [Magnetospirillum molischianum DSM 120]
MNASFRGGSGGDRHSLFIGIPSMRKEKWSHPVIYRAIRVVFAAINFALAIPACAATSGDAIFAAGFTPTQPSGCSFIELADKEERIITC